MYLIKFLKIYIFCFCIVIRLKFKDKISFCIGQEEIKNKTNDKPAVYIIYNKKSLKIIHIGKTNNLYGRIWNQHVNGGGEKAGSDLIDKVSKLIFFINKLSKYNREKPKKWIFENCSFSFINILNPYDLDLIESLCIKIFSHDWNNLK